MRITTKYNIGDMVQVSNTKGLIQYIKIDLHKWDGKKYSILIEYAVREPDGVYHNVSEKLIMRRLKDAGGQ